MKEVQTTESEIARYEEVGSTAENVDFEFINYGLWVTLFGMETTHGMSGRDPCSSKATKGEQ